MIIKSSKIDLSNYQTKSDNNLKTNSKEIVGAINELKLYNNVQENVKQNNYTLYVDLDDWGIHNGLLEERQYTFDTNGNPTPKYTNEEWEIAYNNKHGLINLLQYAKENNYSEVVLPYNSKIFICYEEENENVSAYWEYGKHPIIIPSNITFDMNYSTIKVIFDSHVANPYDKSKHSEANPVSRLCGHIFAFDKSYYSSIKNGFLIGELYERAFDDGLIGLISENGNDYTLGINMCKGSSFITIENMVIKGFMADGISAFTDHDPDKGRAISNPNFVLQCTINNSGQEVDEDGSYTTDYLSIEDWTTREGIMRTNIGYVRVPAFKNLNFVISYYDEDKNYLTQRQERYLQNILIPTKAKFVRITALHEELDKEMPFTLDFQFTPKAGEFCTIRNCEITENHRGGISNMLNNTIIEKCKIYNNGEGTLEGLPVFPDGTRYAINCEDCLSLNLTVRDCYIYDTFYGVLFAGNNVTVENCIFKNINQECLRLYNCESANFTLNKVYNCMSCVSNIPSSLYSRYINVCNNMLFNSGLTDEITSNTGINYFVNNNSIKGIFKINSSKDVKISNLVVDYQRKNNSYTNVSANLVGAKDVSFILNDTFISTAKFYLTTDDKCKDIYVYSNETLNSNAPICTDFLNNTFIKNGSIQIKATTKLSSDDTKFLSLNNCELINSSINYESYINNKDQYAELKVVNTSISSNNTKNSVIHANYYNNEFYKNYSYVFENCKIEINGEFVSNFIYISTCKLRGEIKFENCEIINTSEVPFNLINFTADESKTELVLSLRECTFIGNIIKTNNDAIVINEE